MVKKQIARILTVLLLAAVAAISGAARAERLFPEALLFTQEVITEQPGTDMLMTVILPHTAREDVNEELKEIIEGMRDEGKPKLKTPEHKGLFKNQVNHLEAGAYIKRTGDRWMSFLLIGRVTDKRDTVWLDMTTRVYDMETGKRILLEDIIREEAWPALSEKVRAQLADMFPEEADAEKLDALCSREGLCSAGMTISPGHLSLIWRADELYSPKLHPNCLMRAEIYVPEMTEMLTDEARAETDCTGYALAALTFDDGPKLGSSNQLLSELQTYGGEYTFFIKGQNIEVVPDIVHREYDAGYSVQSHTWDHSITVTEAAVAMESKTKMDETMRSVIGTIPKMMRSPGGQDYRYREFHLGLPLIRWSVDSGDADSENDRHLDSTRVRYKVLRAEDGDIVLLHDTNPKGREHARAYMTDLLNKNLMLVTVDDLCALRGIDLEPNAEIHEAPAAPTSAPVRTPDPDSKTDGPTPAPTAPAWVMQPRQTPGPGNTPAHP